MKPRVIPWRNVQHSERFASEHEAQEWLTGALTRRRKNDLIATSEWRDVR